MNEDEVLNVRAGKLELHCRGIELTQCGTSSPRQVVGPGRIYQHADGTLRLTMYPDVVPRMPGLGLPHGGTVPEDRYWDLRWIDPHLVRDRAHRRPDRHDIPPRPARP